MPLNPSSGRYNRRRRNIIIIVCGACLTPHRRRRGLLLEERPPPVRQCCCRYCGGHLFLDVPSGRRVHHHTISPRLCHRSTFAMRTLFTRNVTSFTIVAQHILNDFRRTRYNRIFHRTRTSTEWNPFRSATLLLIAIKIHLKWHSSSLIKSGAHDACFVTGSSGRFSASAQVSRSIGCCDGSFATLTSCVTCRQVRFTGNK